MTTSRRSRYMAYQNAGGWFVCDWRAGVILATCRTKREAQAECRRWVRFDKRIERINC